MSMCQNAIIVITCHSACHSARHIAMAQREINVIIKVLPESELGLGIPLGAIKGGGVGETGIKWVVGDVLEIKAMVGEEEIQGVFGVAQT